jgi:hypothetical protein
LQGHRDRAGLQSENIVNSALPSGPWNAADATSLNVHSCGSEKLPGGLAGDRGNVRLFDRPLSA